MASQGSTIFTVGTLLNRAQEQGAPVRVLVEGVWIEGIPVASDGHGVIIDNPTDGQYLVRTNAITVVVYVRQDAAEGSSQESPFSATAEQEHEEERTARPGYAPAARAAVEAGVGAYT